LYLLKTYLTLYFSRISYWTPQAKGFKRVHFHRLASGHGIDQIWRKGNIYVIVEAKGGTGKLAKGQMSQKWIKTRTDRLKDVNPELVKKLRAAYNDGSLKGMVVTTKVEGASAFVPQFELKNWAESHKMACKKTAGKRKKQLWTKCQVDMLAKLFPTNPTSKTAIKFGHKTEAVKKKAVLSMRLYERLGISKKNIRPDLCINAFARMAKEPIKDPGLLPCRKDRMVLEGKALAKDYYYLEEKEKARNSARNLLDYTKEFFFGKWRNDVPDYPSDTENWVQQFRQSICWGSCLGEWKKVKELAEYPKDDVIEAERWEPIEWRSWYLLVAGILRGQSLRELTKYVKIIEGGKKRREKLLLDLLRAILGNNAKKAQGSLEGYLKYYKKYEFARPGMNDLLCFDGTFLVNFARHRGLDISFPPQYSDHYIKL